MQCRGSKKEGGNEGTAGRKRPQCRSTRGHEVEEVESERNGPEQRRSVVRRRAEGVAAGEALEVLQQGLVDQATDGRAGHVAAGTPEGHPSGHLRAPSTVPTGPMAEPTAEPMRAPPRAPTAPLAAPPTVPIIAPVFLPTSRVTMWAERQAGQGNGHVRTPEGKGGMQNATGCDEPGFTEASGVRVDGISR